MLIVGIFLNMVLADADFYSSIEYGIIPLFMIVLANSFDKKFRTKKQFEEPIHGGRLRYYYEYLLWFFSDNF